MAGSSVVTDAGIASVAGLGAAHVHTVVHTATEAVVRVIANVVVIPFVILGGGPYDE